MNISIDQIKRMNIMMQVISAANEQMQIINQSMYTDEIKQIQKMKLISYTSMLLNQIKSATTPISFNTLLIDNIR